MKVGDLVKAPHLMDHHGPSDESVGIVIGFEADAVKVLFANGSRYVFPHLVEVVSESR